MLAYAMWGAAVLYWPHLAPADAAEIFAHRIVWAVATLAIVVTLRGSWRLVISLLRDRRERRLLCATSSFLSLNWGAFIYASLTEQVLQAALGYFIAPLILVALGVIVLRERLRPAKWTAVALGGVGLTILLIAHGGIPWMAVLIAGSFCGFVFFKKRTRSAAPKMAVEGLTVETTLMFAPASAFIIVGQARGTGHFGHVSISHTMLMIGAGVLSVIALLLLSAALSRGKLTSMGFVSYVEPSLQFLIGKLILGEAMSVPRWASFVLVWTGIALLLLDGYVERRTTRVRLRHTHARPARSGNQQAVQRTPEEPAAA